MNYKNYIKMPLLELISEADKLRKKYNKPSIEICAIINAKSGKCSEDCKYCAQSRFHDTKIQSYPLKNENQILMEAVKAEKNKAERFGIVTSGNRLTDSEINVIAKAVKLIKQNTRLSVCGSLGALRKEHLQQLKVAGIERYHHNIETSRNFYSKIVSTHTFDERIETIKIAKELGFSICSGGIIGLGESWDDRIDMALELKDLGIDSVPINILTPIKGTKLEYNTKLSYVDIIRTIAIFRIILEDKTIRLAGGREVNLGDFQGLGFAAGANGFMINGYLTTDGRSVEVDWQLAREVEKLWIEC